MGILAAWHPIQYYPLISSEKPKQDEVSQVLPGHRLSPPLGVDTSILLCSNWPFPARCKFFIKCRCFEFSTSGPALPWCWWHWPWTCWWSPHCWGWHCSSSFEISMSILFSRKISLHQVSSEGLLFPSQPWFCVHSHPICFCLWSKQ